LARVIRSGLRNLFARPVLIGKPGSTDHMSKENPDADPRRQTDWKSTKQSDEPWKGSTEKEQKPGNEKPDLEKWKDTQTH
jgi:hypothetical protein